MELALDARPTELEGRSTGEALLTPTRLYPRAVQAVLAAGVDVRAMSHITGGGIPGNLPRVLPEGIGLRIERAWPRAPIFDLVKRAAGVDETEMRRTFNVGVGFVFVVPATELSRAEEALRAAGEAPFVLGSIVRVPADRPFEERVEWPA
jgi:phosphoribosylformylglycinamidine cyclo-ligase